VYIQSEKKRKNIQRKTKNERRSHIPKKIQLHLNTNRSLGQRKDLRGSFRKKQNRRKKEAKKKTELKKESIPRFSYKERESVSVLTSSRPQHPEEKEGGEDEAVLHPNAWGPAGSPPQGVTGPRGPGGEGTIYLKKKCGGETSPPPPNQKSRHRRSHVPKGWRGGKKKGPGKGGRMERSTDIAKSQTRSPSALRDYPQEKHNTTRSRN